LDIGGMEIIYMDEIVGAGSLPEFENVIPRRGTDDRFIAVSIPPEAEDEA
jgi:hypothetical protein